MRIRAAIVWTSFVALASASSGQVLPPTQRGLTLAFAPDQLTIGGVSPRGEIAVIGVGRFYEQNAMSRRFWKEVATDEDGDGTIDFKPAGGRLPDDSIWAVSDLATGRVVVAVPPQSGRPEESSPNLAIPEDATHIRGLRKQVYILVAKGTRGTWFASAGDGAPNDADGVEDGMVDLDLASAEPMGSTTNARMPLGFVAGDRIVLIDPDRMQFFAADLDQLPALAD